MDTKEAYKAKFEARLEAAEATLFAMKASAKERTADGRIAWSSQIEALERGVSEGKAKLAELTQIGEDNWIAFKARLEVAWSKATEAFKDEAAPEAGATEPTSDTGGAIAAELALVSDEALRELTHRVENIADSYREVADKVGQLYACSKAYKFGSLTHRLEMPMRSASDNEQILAAVLADLHTYADGRQ